MLSRPGGAFAAWGGCVQISQHCCDFDTQRRTRWRGAAGHPWRRAPERSLFVQCPARLAAQLSARGLEDGSARHQHRDVGRRSRDLAADAVDCREQLLRRGGLGGTGFGDHDQALAAELAGTTVFGRVTPDQKARIIRAERSLGSTVAFLGDGVNDAAALSQADLGIAMGSGTDAAIAASDLTLMRHDLMLAVDAIRLSRRTLNTIRGNLFWAFIYNVCAIPIAALGYLNPMFAGAAMAFSSVFVVTNSLRLRTWSPKH